MDLARELGIARITSDLMGETRRKISLDALHRPQEAGRLVLVSAINPTCR